MLSRTVIGRVYVGEVAPLAVPPGGLAHAYVTPLVGFAVRVAEAVLQIIPSLFIVPDVSAMLIVAGIVFTITVAVAVAEHEVVELVIVTV